MHSYTLFEKLFKKNQNSRLGSSLKVFIQQKRTALIQQDCELCIFAMGWNNKKKNWSSKYRDGVIFQFLYHTIYRIGQMWVHFYVIFFIYSSYSQNFYTKKNFYDSQKMN